MNWTLVRHLIKFTKTISNPCKIVIEKSKSNLKQLIKLNGYTAENQNLKIIQKLPTCTDQFTKHTKIILAHDVDADLNFFYQNLVNQLIIVTTN